MGIDTCAKLLGHIYPEQILDFIIKNFDSNAKIKNYTIRRIVKIPDCEWIKEYYGESIFVEYLNYSINFEYKNKKINLSYYYSNINSWESVEYYAPIGLEFMAKSETTYVSIPNFGYSVEIIKSITSYFGGWINENDCDDEPYYYIPPNPVLNKNQPKIIHLTRQQICDKYDVDYIIIDD